MECSSLNSLTVPVDVFRLHAPEEEACLAAFSLLLVFGCVCVLSSLFIVGGEEVAKFVSSNLYRSGALLGKEFKVLECLQVVGHCCTVLLNVFALRDPRC